MREITLRASDINAKDSENRQNGQIGDIGENGNENEDDNAPVSFIHPELLATQAEHHVPRRSVPYSFASTTSSSTSSSSTSR